MKKAPFWHDQPFTLQYKDKNGDISFSLFFFSSSSRDFVDDGVSGDDDDVTCVLNKAYALSTLIFVA